MKNILTVLVLALFAAPLFASDLCDELQGDPLGRGYAAMTDAEVSADLLTAYRVRQITSITGRAVRDLTDDAEFWGLSDAHKQAFLTLTTSTNLDPWGVDAKIITRMFGATSTTINALADARTENISRAEELGLSAVEPEDVTEERKKCR